MAPDRSSSRPVLDNTITVGNLLTIGVFIISFIVTITIYKSTVDSHSERLDQIEQNQKILESRIQLLEQEMIVRRQKTDQMQQDIDRTVTYLQLLLENNGIKYVK